MGSERTDGIRFNGDAPPTFYPALPPTSNPTGNAKITLTSREVPDA